MGSETRNKSINNVTMPKKEDISLFSSYLFFFHHTYRQKDYEGCQKTFLGF